MVCKMCGIFLMIKVLLPCYSEHVNEEGFEMRSNSFYQADKMATKLLDIGAIFQIHILPSSFRRRIVPFCWKIFSLTVEFTLVGWNEFSFLKFASEIIVSLFLLFPDFSVKQQRRNTWQKIVSGTTLISWISEFLKSVALLNVFFFFLILAFYTTVLHSYPVSWNLH